MTADDLADLLDRAAGGDQEAFQRLYEATSAKLFGIILRILRDRAFSEDILQEAYLRIWENASRYDRATASPITWMATIARNRAIDEARRRSTRPAADEQALERLVDPTPSPDRAAAAKEALRRLSTCMDEIEPERASMVRQAYLEGYSRQDLADRFHMPIGTVKTWLRRSLRQLQDCMDR